MQENIFISGDELVVWFLNLLTFGKMLSFSKTRFSGQYHHVSVRNYATFREFKTPPIIKCLSLLTQILN